MVKGDGKYLSADYEKVVDVFLAQFTQQDHPNITREVLRSILFDDDYSPSDEVVDDLANSTFDNVEKLKLAMLQFPLKQVGSELGDIAVLGSLYNGGDQHLKLSDMSEMERFKNSVSTGADELIGNVKADDGETIVLENGTDGTDATFTGNVKANNGTTVLENGTDGTDATFTGNLTGNVDGVVGGNDPAAVTGTTITANTKFIGDLAGDVTGNVTGNLTGNVIGDVTGDVTGNADTATKIASITNSNIVQLTEPQTLTNKTLTSPTITGTGNIAGSFTGDVIGNVTGNADTATKIASITNSNIVQLTEPQTLTNKTLTSPTITGTGNIAGSFTGDVTGNVDGIVGGNTPDAVTGTTITANTKFIGDLSGNADTATKIASITNNDIVQLTEPQTLTNKTLTSPTITGTGNIAGSFTGDVKGNVDGIVGGNTPNAVTGTTITANTKFIGDLSGNLTNSNGIIFKVDSSNTTNIAVGNNALISSISGDNKIAVGEDALYSDVSGNNNIAIGYSALHNNVNGVRNIAVGNSALINNSANDNIAVGNNALLSNVSGDRNTAVGNMALWQNLANDNTAVGNGSLIRNKTGTLNTAVGFAALEDCVDGSNNTAIGYSSGILGGATVFNATAIGSMAKAPASNTIKLGNDDVTDIKTNNSCRISGGILGLPLAVETSISTTAESGMRDGFFTNVAGTRGDIRIGNDSGGNLYLMVCKTTGAKGSAVWNSLKFNG